MTTALSVYNLRYTIQAKESLALDQHPGSSLRGALYRALLQRFCALPHQRDCATCPLAQSCPVAALVAPLREEQPRGRDVPRPFIIRPPLIAASGYAGLHLVAGQRTCFDLALIGSAARLFPYVAMSTPALESSGIGRPLHANGGRRGRFTVDQIVAHHPFTGEEVMLYRAGQSQVSVPDLAVTSEEVVSRAIGLSNTALTLQFLTPTRLIAEKKLVAAPNPPVLIHRLAERLDALEREYAPSHPTGEVSGGRWQTVAQSSNVRLVAHDTKWVDTRSYSSRQQRQTPTGGFIGTARLVGDFTTDLRTLLVWGEVVHVGKDSVKGNGWYQIAPQ